MPSFFIFQCKVERFIPGRAAAPFGAAENPVALTQRPQDVLSLRLGQRDGHLDGEMVSAALERWMRRYMHGD